MQRLEPMPVPWMVSPSGSDLELIADERGRAHVSFTAYDVDGEYFKIVVDFENITVATIRGPFCDSDVAGMMRFDRTNIDKIVDLGRKTIAEHWQSSGTCPDPRAYRVIGSSWLDELSASEHDHHYLIVGHDAFVEVVARSANWGRRG